MQRRTLVHAAAALAVPVPARVQGQAVTGGPMRRIAFLSPGSDPLPGVPFHQRRGLVQMWGSVGLVEGQNIVIERRWADGNLDRLPELAAELLKSDPEVLIAIGPAAPAAARLTRKVPIVAVFPFLPVEQGLAENIARPGRNVTGITHVPGPEVIEKRLQVLRELLPSATRLTYLLQDQRVMTVSGEPLDALSGARAAAAKFGFEMSVHAAVRRPEQVERALAEVAAARAQVVSVSGSPYIPVRQQVAEFALRQRWVTASIDVELFDAGLVQYTGIAPAELARVGARMAQMTEQILRGAKPAEMPMELPMRWEMALNLKTTRALGLAVPRGVLLQADRVVE